MARQPKPIEILTAEHYDAIQAELRRLNDVPYCIDKAEQLGVNCKEYREMLKYSVEWLENALKVYFPKGRPR